MVSPPKLSSPEPAQVVEQRELVQTGYVLGITAAQDWCAASLHTSRRAFQQWEVGDRAMHPAFWELLRLKTAHLLRKRS